MSFGESLLKKLRIFVFIKIILKKIQKKIDFLALKRIFEFLILIITIFYFVLIPVQLSFSLNFIENSTNSFIKLIIDLSIPLFLIDILSNFFIKEKRNSSKTLFMTDFLSILYIFLSFLAIKPWVYNDLLSFFYFFRIRNLRILLKSFEEFFIKSTSSSIFFEVFVLIIKVLYFSHIITCLWHHIGFMNMENSENWLVFKGIFSEDWTIRYIESLYFIAAMFNKIGFEEKIARNPLEKAFCICAFYSSTAIFI